MTFSIAELAIGTSFGLLEDKLCARPFAGVNSQFFPGPMPETGYTAFMRLTVERAAAICREFGVWFGPPLLSRCAPAAIRTPADILDGHVRFKGLHALLPLDGIPALVFPPGHRSGLYSIGKRQYLLPRLLLLCGHPERAWEHTPECWRDSVGAIESFLNVERSSAVEVWAAGKEILDHQKGLVRARRQVRRKPHEQQTTHDIVRLIRSGLRARAEGEPFGLTDVEELVGFK
jgi:hypothetical protein